MDKIVAERFVEGRDAYVARIPLLDVLDRANAIEDEEGQGSFALGFLDGVISDLRDCADNARDELAARK